MTEKGATALDGELPVIMARNADSAPASTTGCDSRGWVVKATGDGLHVAFATRATIHPSPQKTQLTDTPPVRAILAQPPPRR
jgi:hypothetical protein